MNIEVNHMEKKDSNNFQLFDWLSAILSHASDKPPLFFVDSVSFDKNEYCCLGINSSSAFETKKFQNKFNFVEELYFV